MNQRQLYILMVLLMVLVLIMDRPVRVQPNQTESDQSSLSENNLMISDRIGRSDKETVSYLGIALSGGGIKALCHAGVLKALEEQQIKPDIMAGVSAGAVVAALYADGYSPDSIISLFKTVNLRKFISFEMPDGGFFSMHGFKLLLDTLLRAETFEELSIPVKVIATDLDRGQSVVFESGNLVDALMASCSVPILFSPYVIDGVNYVDGGVLQNLPAFALRKDCRILVGVSTGPMKSGAYDKSIANIALRSYSFIFRNNARFAKEICDLVIEPVAVNQYSGADVLDYKQLFDIGYQEASKLLSDETIRRILKEK